MNKKNIALILTILFIFTQFAQANTQITNVINDNKILIKNNNPNELMTTIYVDDDNTDGPWDGTFDNPYQFIQDGINNSNNGDTIVVMNGNYPENVIVKRSIKLNGEDKESTIIDGKGSYKGVLIISDDVEISNFTIKNVYSDWWDSCGITVKADNALIQDNILTNNKRGFLLYQSTNSKIEKNIFSYNDIIIIENSYQNHFCKNTITKNTFLVQNSDYNTIRKNVIEGEYWTNGIYLEHSSNNHICYNTITNCTQGIELYSEYELRNSGCNRNQIYYNHFEGIQSWGLFIEKGFFNKVHHNNFVKCGITAFISGGFMNTWYRNYWERPRLLPKRVFGFSSIITGRFDWLPKFLPNNIS